MLKFLLNETSLMKATTARIPDHKFSTNLYKCGWKKGKSFSLLNK